MSMKVYEALAKAFQMEGTPAVFGMIGETNQHWVDAIVKLDIPYYSIRHEGPAVAMAEGWTQVTGQPGVVSVASGCGVANLACQLLVASRSHTPLVVFAGDGKWGSDDENQRLDHKLFADACESEFVRVASAEGAYDAVQKAFYIARQRSCPVILSAPKDVQLKEFDDLLDYTPSTELLNTIPLVPNPDAIRHAADLIEGSERVVVLVGKGARESCTEDQILSLATRTGALVATSLLAMNWLRDKYDYHAGMAGLFSTDAAMGLLADADCVIAIGASMNRHTTVHGYLFPNARYVHVDRQPQVIHGTGSVAECYVQAEAALGVAALDAALESRSVTRVGYRTPDTAEKLEGAWIDDEPFDIAPGSLDPREVYRVLDDAVPSEFGLNIGGGHQAQMSAMGFVRRRPWILASKQFGAMGKGIIGTIGAVLATKTPAVIAEGDGGIMLHLAEFETAVRYDVPILVAVMNDQGLSAEVKKAWIRDLDPGPSQMSTPDMGELGRAMGGRGEFIESLDHLREAVRRFVDDPAPTMLDIRIPEGVPSIPHRRVHLGRG